MREGAVVARYQIGRVVGRGGMAVVYAGEHRVLRYRVAVKVLHPDHLENPSMERRFLNEARALAAIRHPGIVELLDVGCAADGRAYLVMEMLEGISLAQRLARGPLPLPQAISFGRQLASALAAAHAKGIVHRDLKPDNILIVRDPDLRRAGEDPRLRHREADHGGHAVATHHADRHRGRDAGLHVAGAVPRAHGCRRAQRHLHARRRALSHGDRAPPVRGGDPRAARSTHARTGGAVAVAGRSRSSSGAWSWARTPM